MQTRLLNHLSIGLTAGVLAGVCGACDRAPLGTRAPELPDPPSTTSPSTGPVVPTSSGPTSNPPTAGLELLSSIPSVNGTPVRVLRQDQYVYLGDWNNQSNAGALDGSVQAYDVADVSRPARLATLFTPGQEVQDLALDGRWLFVANDAWGLRIVDVGHPDDLRSITNRSNGGLYATSVAVARQAATGQRHVLVGYLYGGALDIHAVPDGGPIPEPVHYTSSSFPGRCDVHRIEVRGDRAYILASDGSTRACIEVLDLSALPAVPAVLGRYCYSFAEYGNIGDLRVAGDLVFLSAADHLRTVSAGGLRIVSIEDERRPTLVGSLDLPSTGAVEWRGAGMALGVASEVFFLTSKGVQVVDVSAPATPTAQGFAPYPDTFGECQGGTAVVEGDFLFVGAYCKSPGGRGGLAVYRRKPASGGPPIR